MPADASIYSQLLRPPRSVDEHRRLAAAADLDQLAVLEGQQKVAGVAQQRARGDQLQALMRGLPAGATDEDRIAALRGAAFFEQADALEKGIGERAAKKATADKAVADTKAAEDKLAREKYERRLQGLRQFTQPEDARQWLADGVTRGDLTMPEATAMMSRVPREPEQFGKWRDDTIMSLMDAAKQAGFITPDANAKLAAGTATAGQAAATARADADRAQRAADAAAGRAVAREGITAANQRAVVAADAAKARGKGPGAMSATLQKELVEADDMVSTTEATAATLRKALELNAKAYSGYAAKQRAQVRSNLPGSSPAADATIELDNLIGSQALEGMKAIFGGNPTEGERAILLDLQASADKTPAQREAIIRRGIAAAERRQRINAARARAIRSGSYLTEGAEAPAGDDAASDDPVEAALRKHGGGQ